MLAQQLSWCDSYCVGFFGLAQTSRNASLRGPWIPRRGVPPFVPRTSLGYAPARWDTINPYYDAESKTLHGWWTAGLRTAPALAGQSAMGYGKSVDGVHWLALPPAILTWPSNTSVGAAGFEIGGVAPITAADGVRRWYAAVCMSHQELPAAIGGRVGCFTFVAAAPGGPYTLAPRNSAIIGSCQYGHSPEYTYYHRFFHAPDGVLTHYQQYDKAHWKREPGTHCYMSPFKRMVVDPVDNTLRMAWWAANDALKIAPAAAHVLGTTRLELRSIRGTIVEGSVRWGDTLGGFCFPYYDTTGGGGGVGGGAKKTRPGTAFVASFMGFNGTHMLTGESTAADCAPTAAALVMNDSLGVADTAPEPSRGLPLRQGLSVPFRLMFRRGMYDLYLQDFLIQSYALPVGGVPYSSTQELRLVGSWANDGTTQLRSWGLKLSDASPTSAVAGRGHTLGSAPLKTTEQGKVRGTDAASSPRTRAATRAASQPIQCQPASMQPNWPTFHVFNQVLHCDNNSVVGCKHNLQLAPLNDANAIFEYPKGTNHVMNQGAMYGEVNGVLGITGVSWKHAVSDNLVQWYRLPDALGPQNTSWGKSGACDGDFSHPIGQGPIITWGPDCGDPLPPPPQPEQQLLLPRERRPLDYPRVAVARPAHPGSALLSKWIPGVPVVFEAGSPPCASAEPVWKSTVGDYYNMVCVSPVDTRMQSTCARYTSRSKTLQRWRLADPHFARGLNAARKSGTSAARCSTGCRIRARVGRRTSSPATAVRRCRRSSLANTTRCGRCWTSAGRRSGSRLADACPGSTRPILTCRARVSSLGPRPVARWTAAACSSSAGFDSG